MAGLQPQGPVSDEPENGAGPHPHEGDEAIGDDEPGIDHLSKIRAPPRRQTSPVAGGMPLKPTGYDPSRGLFSDDLRRRFFEG